MSHYDRQREEANIAFIDSQNAEAVKQALLVALKEVNRQAELEEALSSEIDTFMEPEFYDFLQVLYVGAFKYERNNWLKPDGSRSSHKEMHDSMFHHLADSYAGLTEDKDSGIHPLLHLASRALMYYTRYKRGIIHPADKGE